MGKRGKIIHAIHFFLLSLRSVKKLTVRYETSIAFYSNYELWSPYHKFITYLR